MPKKIYRVGTMDFNNFKLVIYIYYSTLEEAEVALAEIKREISKREGSLFQRLSNGSRKVSRIEVYNEEESTWLFY